MSTPLLFLKSRSTSGGLSFPSRGLCFCVKILLFEFLPSHNSGLHSVIRNLDLHDILPSELTKGVRKSVLVFIIDHLNQGTLKQSTSLKWTVNKPWYLVRPDL